MKTNTPPAASPATRSRAVDGSWWLRGSAWYELAAIIGVLVAAILSGCDSGDIQPRTQSVKEQIAEQLFSNAFQLLNVIDDFETDDATQQVVDRLNQWLLTQQVPADWFPDSLVATLPADIRASAPILGLANPAFTTGDGLTLQEAVWLREAAKHAVESETGAVARAERLFDWTVRNIALVDQPTEAGVEASMPWRTMLLGRGTIEERAWVFTLLARQQQLDVVLLAIGDAKNPPALRVWAAALMHDGQLYLFDPKLGLPLYESDNKTVLTLKKLRSQRELLTALSVGNEHYSLSPDDLDHVVALVEASPMYLSARARMVEQRLAGAQRLELSVPASALIKQAKACDGITGAQLWNVSLTARRPLSATQRLARADELAPFTIIKGRPLWRGRIRHLMGRYTGEQGAIHYYTECRIARDDVADALQAKHITPEDAQLVARMKQHASYWMGEISWERANFDSAVDYFGARTLSATPNGPWTDAARYNLGRVYETLGNNVEAARQFQASKGPQYLGNLLRAQRLGSAPPGVPPGA